MITRKKLKTKRDYQARTFGLCVVVLFLFTLFVISPEVENLEKQNEVSANALEKAKSENATLKEEFDYYSSKTTIEQID